jgi:HlyD family secretion protein
MRRKRLLLFLLLLAAVGVGAGFYIAKRNGQLQRDILTLYGNVDVRQVDLGFRVAGQVKTLFFEEGDQVQPGLLLAKLDTAPYADQVKEAQASVAGAKANLLNTEQILQRREELVSEGSISKEDLDNAFANHKIQVAALEQAEASLAIATNNLAYTDLNAPSDGVILTRIREVGTVVTPGDAVYTVSLTSPVWIRGNSSWYGSRSIYRHLPREGL